MCAGTQGAGAAEWEDWYCMPHSLLSRSAQVSGAPSLLKHQEGTRDTQSTEERKWVFTRLPLHTRRDAATILCLTPILSLAQLPGARPGEVHVILINVCSWRPWEEAPVCDRWEKWGSSRQPWGHTAGTDADSSPDTRDDALNLGQVLKTWCTCCWGPHRPTAPTAPHRWSKACLLPGCSHLQPPSLGLPTGTLDTPSAVSVISLF